MFETPKEITGCDARDLEVLVNGGLYYRVGSSSYLVEHTVSCIKSKVVCCSQDGVNLPPCLYTASSQDNDCVRLKKVPLAELIWRENTSIISRTLQRISVPSPGCDVCTGR